MAKKNVLVIGSGGREHAIVHALSRSPEVGTIFCATVNAGTRLLAKNIALPVTAPFREIIAFAKENAVDLAFVGPEDPLVNGIVDAFRAQKLRIFGPDSKAAQVEGSKVFTKRLLIKHTIPTAYYSEFRDHASALAFVKANTPPYVFKADGLAAGKGVIIAMNREDGISALDTYFKEKRFGAAGETIVIEEFMEGEEASILAFTDGKDIALLAPSQDHKRVFDNDAGPNTGGMGAYAPIKLVDDALLDEVKHSIIEKSIEALAKEGITYTGVLYAGLMIKDRKARVVEFNCRLGDPETEAVLPLLENDLYELACAVCDGTLSQIKMKKPAKQAATIVIASGGYPGDYKKGIPIDGNIERTDGDIAVYHCGTKYENGKYFTNGGRVLSVTATGATLKGAIDSSYSYIRNNIRFDGMHYRTDIGKKGL
ncbi:MAG: phosphoribosylamine--glycine ligase [Spirochaetota bacterium]